MIQSSTFQALLCIWIDQGSGENEEMDSVSLRWDQRSCISNKILPDAAGVCFEYEYGGPFSPATTRKTDDRDIEDQAGYLHIFQKQGQGKAGICPLLE